MIVKQFKHFKHVGKVYCLNIGDSFYTKCGNVLNEILNTGLYRHNRVTHGRILR